MEHVIGWLSAFSSGFARVLQKLSQVFGAMLRAFEDFRAGSELARRREVFLKIGLHAGACYVVTANKVLDYFGQSVNVAARVPSSTTSVA